MSPFFKPAAVFFLASSLMISGEQISLNKSDLKLNTIQAPAPKIQVAILLDVSNSMDGLIEQAKAQLWNMVSVMGRAKCPTGAPQIQLALYEYGRSNNDKNLGYVKQVSPFTHDLDEVSKNLFALTTNGGDEYCGQVIYTSINDLNWDKDTSSYKVIFIAGNEDFLQGSLTYTKACSAARDKGVIVNTIYCGSREQGIREHWNLGSECGSGSFTHINPDARIEDIPTPQDSMLFVLNTRLNQTYIGYGNEGYLNTMKQSSVDAKNYTLNKSAMAKRVSVKGNKSLYKNEEWDLVDAHEKDSTIVARVELKTLPDSLKHKSRADLEKIVKTKKSERNQVQQQIARLSVDREKYLQEYRKIKSSSNSTPTLESEIEKIIRSQAAKVGMKIE